MAAAKPRIGAVFEQLEELLREEFAGKQDLLAEGLGVPPSSVYRWVNRKNHPRKEYILKIESLYRSQRIAAAIAHELNELDERDKPDGDAC